MVGNYSQENMLAYYLLLPTVSGLVSAFVLEKLPKMIKDGDISMDLLKPYSLAATIMIRNLGVKAVQQLFKIPIYVSILYFGTILLNLHWNFEWLFTGAVVALFSYVLNFWLSYSLSMIAFWMDDIWALSLLVAILLLIFGGLAFPVDIVPISYRWIFTALPFQFIYYFPVSIAQGKLDVQTVVIGVSKIIAWILFFYFVSRSLWKQGLKKYGAYGQ